MTTLVLKKIKEIKEHYGGDVQCYLVATILAGNFGGMIWYDHDHCITMIDNEFYDKKGKFPVSDLGNCGYLPLHQYGMDIENTLIKSAHKFLSLQSS